MVSPEFRDPNPIRIGMPGAGKNTIGVLLAKLVVRYRIFEYIQSNYNKYEFD